MLCKINNMTNNKINKNKLLVLRKIMLLYCTIWIV